MLASLLACVAGAWAYMIASMARTFRRSPLLDGFERGDGPRPRVSVILPARNEEGFIGRCLDSLERQDYDDYEVVAVDDSSGDGTWKIISEHAAGSGRVVPVPAAPKPGGWMGKNWACMEGYRRATGELLLFTDADTVHSPGVITLAVGHLESLGLDALTVVPRMRMLDFWTGAALPVISTFLHTRFSPLNVNDPAKGTGYFFGSFFVMRRAAYEGVGTHAGVRGEIIEDGALGKRTKEAGYAMRMVRGEHLVEAVWARDGPTLWDGLKRLMVPLYLQSGRTAAGILAAVAFLLVAPFAALPGPLLLPPGPAAWALAAASAAASALACAGAAVDARAGLGAGPWACLRHAALAPLGGLVVVAGFAAGLARARGSASVTWRGRSYSVRDHAQDSINV